MSTIQNIQAREILDSRGIPTLQVEIVLNNKIKTKACVPSGTSTSKYEARELRDGNKKRFEGKGVLKACENVNTKITKALKGIKITEQEKIDKTMIELDGTKNKSKLGANAILGVSLACARAAALSCKIPLWQYLAQNSKLKTQNSKLPVPLFNIFNGGKHADTNLDFQEFLIIPFGKKGFVEKVRMGAEVFHKLGEVLKDHWLDTDTGLEGGYAPNIDSSVEAVELILESIEKAGLKPGKDIVLGIDVGASMLYDQRDQRYVFTLDAYRLFSDQLISLYKDWTRKYPLFLIEDGLAEDDWENWKKMTEELKVTNYELRRNKIKDFLMVGDDIFATNKERLLKGIKEGVANAVIAKPNQIGTLTETIEFINLAQKSGYKIIISHRSGETCDHFISDLAVAVNASFVKAGSLSRGERVSKYNRLIEIEEELDR